MFRLTLALFALTLFAPPWPPAPPTIAWRDPAHVVVTWSQPLDGERCFAKEAPPAPIYEYGCEWAWQGPNTVTLPRPTHLSGPVPVRAIPKAGDTIVVGEERATVPTPHFVWLPIVR